MKRMIGLAALLLINLGLMAQSGTTNGGQPKYSQQAAPQIATDGPGMLADRIYYGGNIGFSFGTVTSVRINPLVGYKLTPRLSVGLTGMYEYIGYETYFGRQHFHNFGGSLFSRFQIVPQAYAHAEYNYMSYEYMNSSGEKYRQGVPFVFLGAGFKTQVGANFFTYAQILFDVLQHPDSPYDAWTPFYSVGFGVGF